MTTVVGNIGVIVQPHVVVLIVSNDMQEQTPVEHCGVVVETTASVFKYLIHNSIDLKFLSEMMLLIIPQSAYFVCKML